MTSPVRSANRTRVYNQQISPTGQRLLVEGDFTRVRGKHRQQIFMLTLRASHAKVTRWRSTEFNQNCADSSPFYIHAASWSPDSRTIYVAATGEAPEGLSHDRAQDRAVRRGIGLPVGGSRGQFQVDQLHRL